jgi:hypothetical protein
LPIKAFGKLGLCELLAPHPGPLPGVPGRGRNTKGQALATFGFIKALVILFDQLLISTGEFFLDGGIDGIAILVAEVAPGALRAAAMQPLDGFGVRVLAPATVLAFFPLTLALSLALAFAPLTLARLVTRFFAVAALSFRFAVFGFLD